MNRNAKIVSTAHYLPERCITNDELNERFTKLGKPEVVGKLHAGTGIDQRWYAPDDWASSDLALPAAKQALEKAGRKPEDVDLIILGTDSPDYITPSTSVVLQQKLGAKQAGTFDVACACASFPTALANAAGLLATNNHFRTILVVGVYMMRKLADPTDPTVFFYGDGAGAAVVEPSEEPGFIGSSFLANGEYSDCWGIYSGGTAEPATEESVRAGRTNVRMVKRYPPEINDEGWPLLFKRLSEQNGFTVDDVDQVIFTQVNRHTVELAADNIGLPQEKAPKIMDKWGYTGSACIPMALSKSVDEGRIKSGDLVVMIGSGVGYNQAAVAFRM